MVPKLMKIARINIRYITPACQSNAVRAKNKRQSAVKKINCGDKKNFLHLAGRLTVILLLHTLYHIMILYQA